MTIEELGALGEVVGAVAVVLSLFYLGRQIRDNSKQVRAAAAIEINRLINDGFDPIYGNPAYLDVWFRWLESRADLNDFDRNLFDLFMARLMNGYAIVLVQSRMEPSIRRTSSGTWASVAPSRSPRADSTGWTKSASRSLPRTR